ncbi:MAG: hypothetical protein ACHQHN_03210 [Sphingobacteriales bacterium]
MKRKHHLKELIDNIRKTEEMISMHKENHTSPMMASQYESLKAKQVSELIDGLAMPPFQSVESISLIKRILDTFYPKVSKHKITQEELRELEAAI